MLQRQSELRCQDKAKFPEHGVWLQLDVPRTVVFVQPT